jgi:hypothetical protein
MKSTAAAVIGQEIRANLRSWLAVSLAFFVGFQLFQLALLVLRFGTVPNYVIVHDWPANIARIARMTPSVADMIPIMLDEWLIEIGSMNYAFGHGIAEWSFVLIPGKAAVVLLVAFLLATNLVLLRAAGKSCSLFGQLGASAMTACGTAAAGASAMTISWVVCCATPTWVVGLSIMGVAVTTALRLAPFGGWLCAFGLLALSATAIALARRLARAPQSDRAYSVAPLPARIAGAVS